MGENVLVFIHNSLIQTAKIISNPLTPKFLTTNCISIISKNSYDFLVDTNELIKKNLKKYRHIVPSNYFKTQLSKIFKINQSIISISPSGGVDTSLFFPRKKQIKNKEFTIGYAGGLISSKGADVLKYLIENTIQIEKRTRKEITYRFINYGEEAKKYITQFKAQNCNLIIDEKMAKSRMPDFYNSIDLLIFPSFRKGESLGLVVLEALSCRIPVITFNLCAFPEFIVPGITGELVEFIKDKEERNRSFLSAVCRVIDNYNNYNPNISIKESYSKDSIISFYKNFIID